jgi:hypothetical protein
MPKVPRNGLNPIEVLGTRSCRAKHDIGMAADVFGRRQDADVDPGRNGGEQQGRRPGVIDQGHDALIPRNGTNGGDVLDLHGQGARTFEQDSAGLVADHLVDPGADQGMVVSGRNPEPLQERVAELAGRAVDAVRDQQFVAVSEDGEQRGGYGRQSRGEQCCSLRTGLQFGQCFRKRPMGRRALEPIPVLA